eukprot:4175092-Alexandrium_andersonii.AAC.1
MLVRRCAHGSPQAQQELRAHVRLRTWCFGQARRAGQAGAGSCCRFASGARVERLRRRTHGQASPALSRRTPFAHPARLHSGVP